MTFPFRAMPPRIGREPPRFLRDASPAQRQVNGAREKQILISLSVWRNVFDRWPRFAMNTCNNKAYEIQGVWTATRL